jgi:hypothetical protein
MPLNPNGSIPEIIIQFGNINSQGLCRLYFDNKPINTFSNDQSLHKIILDPMVLLGSSDSEVKDLIKKEVGWVVTFTNFKGPIQFSFTLDIRQSNVSVITPVIVTETSPNVVNAGESLIFNGFLTLT